MQCFPSFSSDVATLICPKLGRMAVAAGNTGANAGAATRFSRLTAPCGASRPGKRARPGCGNASKRTSARLSCLPKMMLLLAPAAATHSLSVCAPGAAAPSCFSRHDAALAPPKRLARRASCRMRRRRSPRRRLLVGRRRRGTFALIICRLRLPPTTSRRRAKGGGGAAGGTAAHEGIRVRPPLKRAPQQHRRGR